MSDVGMVTTSGGRGLDVQGSRNDVLGELAKNGYAFDVHLTGSQGEIVCRHPTAPPLIVHPDGGLELAKGNHLKLDRQVIVHAPAKRIHWDRAALIFGLLALATFLGLLIVGMIAG